MGMKYIAFVLGFIYFYCANCLETGQKVQQTRHRFSLALIHPSIHLSPYRYKLDKRI